MAGAGLEAALTRAWLTRGPFACVLWPVSLLFHALSSLRAAAYRTGLAKSERLPVPVVVVGNIFIGGTGKTPLTIWLADALRARGLTPGVISRGFGRDADSILEVTPDSASADAGDEPLLIAQRAGCPVFVGRRRVEAGRALLQAHPEVDVIIADDGLQHYALQRDVEIILFDARGAGNGWLLPAGPLREPPSRRRDVTVVNAPALTPELRAAVRGEPFQMTLDGEFAERLADRRERRPLAAMAYAPQTGQDASPAAQAGHRASAPPTGQDAAPATQAGHLASAPQAGQDRAPAAQGGHLASTPPAGRAARLVAAAGIGNPARFFTMLRAAGLQFDELPLPDHYDFAADPFAALQADAILITEKDAVKCGQLKNLKHDPRLWVVPVAAQIDPALADRITQQILEKRRGRPSA